MWLKDLNITSLRSRYPGRILRTKVKPLFGMEAPQYAKAIAQRVKSGELGCIEKYFETIDEDEDEE